MASLRRMSSNIAAQILGVAASLIDRIVLVGFLLRIWGPDVFADYSVVQSWAALLAMAELGVQIYFLNQEQAAYVGKDRSRFRRFAATHLGLSLCIVGALGVGFTALVAFGGADRVYRLAHIDAHAARLALWLFGMGNLLAMLRAPASAIFSATGDFAYVTLLAAGVLVVNTSASLIAVLLGAGPVTLAALFFAISGAGGAAFYHLDLRHRRPDWAAPPALPTRAEFALAASHVKWFSLQMIAPTVWLQTPILIYDSWGVHGRAITSFVLMRTMVNQIRQAFQFAAVGAGLEIATHAHRRDYAEAWRLSAEIGRLTTVLSGVCVAGVLSFGPTVTLYWTGDASLYSAPVALAMLVPLMAVAPLQQPFAMLQYANRSETIGLLRLSLIVWGPLFCIAGQALGGPFGLLVGLAAAEMLAHGSLAPRLSRMPLFPGFVAYCARALAEGIATAGIGFAVGSALQALAPPASLPLFLAEVALWAGIAGAPPIVWALPEYARRALWERLAPRRAPSET